jgi:hypothetical protein
LGWEGRSDKVNFEAENHRRFGTARLGGAALVRDKTAIIDRSGGSFFR